MKKIILLSWLLTACSITIGFAQLEGKKFVSATVGLNFNNTNQDDYPTATNYGYNIDASFGKFKTANKASGFNIGTSLYGQKATLYPDGTREKFEGITGFGVSTGYFWQHYKHFSDKFGIFGGPHVNVFYSYSKLLPNQSGDNLLHRQHHISPQFGVSAGTYYALNERWWLTASLGFANLLYVSYTIDKAEPWGSGNTNKTKTFDYKLTPNITLPSVSLGLRYFFRD